MKAQHTAALLAALFCAAGAHAQLKPSAGQGLTPRLGAPAPAPAAAPAQSKEVSDKEAAGKLAAHAWLVVLDRRDWGRAWDSASNMFRAAVPLASWMDGIPKVRADLGNFVDRVPQESQYKTTLEGRPAGEYVTVAFASKFEKKELVELVTVVLENGAWRVTGYSTR